MGKYQLDDKGRAQVTRYHEKHSKGGVGKKERLLNLREQFLNKSTKKYKCESALTFLFGGMGIWNYADRYWQIKKRF